MQRLAAEEVLRREGQDEHFVPQTGAYKSIPDDEEDGSFATASLCFGFPFTFENLTEQLLLGRRWYKAELKHASQSLDQIPHCQSAGTHDDTWRAGPRVVESRGTAERGSLECPYSSLNALFGAREVHARGEVCPLLEEQVAQHGAFARVSPRSAAGPYHHDRPL